MPGAMSDTQKPKQTIRLSLFSKKPIHPTVVAAAASMPTKSIILRRHFRSRMLGTEIGKKKTPPKLVSTIEKRFLPALFFFEEDIGGTRQN